MASTSVSNPLPSSSTADFATDDTFLGFKLEVIDSNKAIQKAKEQLHRVMEAKEEEDMKQWMEKRWEEQMSEWDSVVRLVDTTQTRPSKRPRKNPTEQWKQRRRRICSSGWRRVGRNGCRSGI